MARAFGGRVFANPRWEIGWGLVQFAERSGVAVQSGADIEHSIGERAQGLSIVATRLYDRCSAGLRR